jgi:hypothetical protein
MGVRIRRRSLGNGGPRSVTFSYTGSDQTWTVPRHVAGSLKFLLVGGQGGDDSITVGLGGSAGYIRGELDLAQGTELTIGLGGGGETATDPAAGIIEIAAGGGGPRPGGDGGIYGTHALSPPDPAVSYDSGGGGGGGSELKVGVTVIAVAGGGGGAGFNSGGLGEDGAAQTGNGGGSLGSPSANSGGQGQGGTTSAAGTGGYSATNKYPTYLEAGADGSGGSGGDGASFIYVPASTLGSSNCGGGGGGGGGYYGGGGGGGGTNVVASGAGGGGGSSWSDNTYVTEGTGPSPLVDTDGYLVIEYTAY